MKVIVTGGYGFIGSHFIRLLNEEFPKATIVVIDKKTYCANPSFVSHIQHTLLEKDINDVVESDLEMANYIVNFAAESHVDKSISNADPFIKSNINGTYALLKTMRKTCPSARFVQISTDEVYGSVERATTEVASLNPTSPYSSSKTAADHIVMSYHKTFGVDTVITRSSNNYGPNQDTEKLIPAALYNLIIGKKVVVYGRGEESRDWIYVRDNCKGILAAMLSGTPGQIYNLGGGVGPTKNINIVKQLIKGIYPEDNPMAHINFIKDPRPGHDHMYWLNIEKASKELGWNPTMSIREGIVSTIQWYKHKFNHGK